MPDATSPGSSTAEPAALDAIVGALREHFGERVRADVSFGGLTVDVPAEDWRAALSFARDAIGARFFDWLTAVDELDAGFDIVARLVVARVDEHAELDLPVATGFLLRTRVSRQDPSLASAVPVYAGANWHERETFEMFGVTFTGHPNLVPLLLPEGFEGMPLRKDFVLASRVAKAWPGAKEPGESDEKRAPSRRRVVPPGVPEGWLKQ